MPIGSDLKYCYSKNNLKYYYLSVFGADLHTHIRLKPLSIFLKKNIDLKRKYRFLELGCGNGINAFELLKIFNNFKYDGFDLNEKAINDGKRIVRKRKLKNLINLYNEDITKFYFYKKRKYDFILLTDILEHITNPLKIIKKIKLLISKDAIILVSVPTYNYKKFFGIKFHEKIGHVKDGYTLSELNNLFLKINCKNIYSNYNTGLFTRFFCSLYYKYNFSNKFLNRIKNTLLLPIHLFDFINDKNYSCSLFSVYQYNGNKRK